MTKVLQIPSGIDVVLTWLRASVIVRGVPATTAAAAATASAAFYCYY